jgi:radical SAM protein with 4Fe4S-binding SPASM domain
LDDYDKDIKSGHFNPFFIVNKPFKEFVLIHYKKVKDTISEILEAYQDFDEEGFNYYQLNVVLNEFIPEVTYKILTGKKLREIRIFPRKRLAFENASLPYIGLKINIEISEKSNNIADCITDFINHNESLCEESIRLNFIGVYSKSKAERIIKKILLRLDNLLSTEIRQPISISYERKNEVAKTEGSFSDFKNWLFDSNAEWSNFYTDFIRQMLYGYSNICEYNSCLGRIFYIGATSSVYACEKKFIPISSAKPLDENVNLIEILEKSVSRRDRCKNQCDVFDYCGGGCPALQSDKTGCISQSTFDLFINGKKIINDILRDNSLPLLNKYAQDVFLEFAAYRYGEEKICLV